MSLVILSLAIVIALIGCGGGVDGGNIGGGDYVLAPSISITEPTTATSYATVWSGVRIGGTTSNVSIVRATNTLTGSTNIGYVTYNQGQGTWFVDVTELGFGENPITVTGDSNGLGDNFAVAYITLIRPLQPLSEIFNGSNQFSSYKYWIDLSSFNGSHKIALFEDGTGRMTTGSVLSENAGSVIDFTWTMLSPDSILITNCPTCSFQMISRISGSINVDVFLGQIETINGAGDLTIHYFASTAGNL